MGGQQVATDRTKLREHGITHVLNCTSDAFPETFQGVPDPIDGRLITYTRLFLYDAKHEIIGCFFFHLVALVEHVRATGGRLFVHCHQVGFE